MQSRRAVTQVTQEESQSFGALLSDLASQSAGLVRDELALAKQEMREKLTSLQAATIVLAVAGVIGLFGGLALLAAVIGVIAQYMDAWKAALLVGLVLTVVAGVTAFVGIGKLKQTNLKPKQTLETLEEDKEWLKEIS